MEQPRKSLLKMTIHKLISIIGLIALLLSVSGLEAAAQGPSKSAQLDPSALMNLCLNANQASNARDPHTGKIIFLGTKAGNPIHQLSALPSSVSPEQAARGYLSDCGTWFGLTDQNAELNLKSQNKAEGGRSVVRFQQSYQNIPVFSSEFVVQLDPSNNIIMASGNILPNIKVNTTATIDGAAAQQAAYRLVAEEYGLDGGTLTASEPQLWIYNPISIQASGGTSELVWRMEVSSLVAAPVRELVLINAQKGSVTLHFNQLDTALNRRTYTSNNTTTEPGTLVCDESNPFCTGGDLDAVNAHVYGGDTYNFYSSYFGRDSLDNAGMTLISNVHYSSGYCNAFWDGVQMTYGDGCFIVVDDVVGHEMTHGVTEYTSGLNYVNESGAINESLSDIFGEFIDLTNGHGTDTPAVRWLMGEDTSIGAIRNMQDPAAYDQPDRMSSPLYYHGTSDNGGVHTNSGIGNKAAYLITDGDTFNGYTITGIGITKAASIFYEAETNILTPSSTYFSLYNALNQACNNLIGTSGITASDCTQVLNATLATEMNTSAPPPTPPANDDFANPIVITATSYSNTQPTTGATTASNDPTYTCVTSQFNNTVWYRFTAAASGTLTVDTLGSNYDTVLAIWTGGAPGSLASAGCNDDTGGVLQSRVSISTTAGQTYQIEIASYGSGGGQLTLNLAASSSATATRTTTPTSTRTLTSTPTRTVSPTLTRTPTRTVSPTLTRTPTRTVSRTPTRSPTRTASPSRTRTPTRTAAAPRPGVPTLISPANNAQLSTYLPTFDWSDATSAHHYQIQVSKSFFFSSSSLVVNQTNVLTSQYTLASPLSARTTYYWRVQTFNSSGQGSGWSQMRTFRTN
jgi:bacillolysin